MTEFVFDDEQLYEIGNEWFTHEVENSEMQKQFKRKDVPYGVNYFCKKCKYKGLIIP